MYNRKQMMKDGNPIICRLCKCMSVERIQNIEVQFEFKVDDRIVAMWPYSKYGCSL